METLPPRKNTNPAPLLLLLFSLFLIHHHHISSVFVDAANVHIVYMGEKGDEDPVAVADSHRDMLATLLGSKEAALDSILYSYKHGFSGFAARLTESQASQISEFPGVVHVIPNNIHKLDTTRSWDFLGLDSNSLRGLISDYNMGNDAIIGVIDSGIWPESESFHDRDMGPIPPRWKGVCQEGQHFNGSNCNRKLIGARWFIKGLLAEMQEPLNTSATGEFLSPRDALRHGTHTASTAAGRFVEHAGFEGLGAGVARGGAPRARLAVYKVCWVVGLGCTDADILKAFDEAIHDGVDVLSVSLRSPGPQFSYVDHDGISIGSFHAAGNGITVVCSGGNSGPFAQTISNTAPWIISVAATTTDRAFPSPITLGNNQTFLGQAINGGKHKGKFTELVYMEDVGEDGFSSSSCDQLFLNRTLVAGKVVLCFITGSEDTSSLAQYTIREAGGVGLIIAKMPSNSISPCQNLSCVEVDYEIGTQILSYLRSSRSPTVKLSPSKSPVGMRLSTKVAYFSSRGPSRLSPAVLKPDIAAPGVNILAAIPPIDIMKGGSNKKHLTNDRGGFGFKSGTSMACPHIAGIAGLLKSLHPEWSPAAIKSAIVTTASTMDRYREPILAEGGPRKKADPFDYGGGLVNPKRAANPGLVYDMSISDYLHFLCSMGYSSAAISKITTSQINCSQKRTSILDLNLPSIAIPILKKIVTVSRTVTNVGPVNSIYKPMIHSPPGVEVVVNPQLLSFNATTTKLAFQITFTSKRMIHGEYSFGSLSWSDGVRVVRSPIAVRSVIYDSYADIS